jgi:hypothetical protein
MKRLLVTALLVAASLLVVGTALTAGASAKASTCKTVKYNETKLVWNAKHTKKIRVVVTKLVKETIKVHGKLTLSYVEEPVVLSVKICTAAKKATAPTTTTTEPVAAVAPAPTPTTQPVPVTVPDTVPPIVITPDTVPTTTTTTTTTTTMPPAAVPGVTISTIFVNPNGVVQVTGTFTNVTSLNFCTDPNDPTVVTAANSPTLGIVCGPTANDPTAPEPVSGTYCSAAIVDGSAQCTLPAYTGYFGEGLNLCACRDAPKAEPPPVLIIASTAGAAPYTLQHNFPSAITTTATYWEYPIPTPPNAGTPGVNVGATSDGPGGSVTVISTGATTSDIEISGEYEDYPDQTDSQTSDILIYPNPNTATSSSIGAVAAPVGDPYDTSSIVVVIGVDESLATLQTSGFQVGWYGGENNDVQYGFPSLNYPYWNVDEIVTFDAARGVWVVTPGTPSYS